jgi:hypothetical protein
MKIVKLLHLLLLCAFGIVAAQESCDSIARHAEIRPENHTTGEFTLIANSCIVLSPTQLEFRATAAQRHETFGEQGCREVWIGQLIQRGQ